MDMLTTSEALGLAWRLRTAAWGLLRLMRVESIRSGMLRMAHAITAMPGMARQEANPTA